jgi:hypothetical protein
MVRSGSGLTASVAHVDHPLCVVTGDPHRVAGGLMSKPLRRLTFQLTGDAAFREQPWVPTAENRVARLKDTGIG